MLLQLTCKKDVGTGYVLLPCYILPSTHNAFGTPTPNHYVTRYNSTWGSLHETCYNGGPWLDSETCKRGSPVSGHKRVRVPWLPFSKKLRRTPPTGCGHHSPTTEESGHGWGEVTRGPQRGPGAECIIPQLHGPGHLQGIVGGDEEGGARP